MAIRHSQSCLLCSQGSCLNGFERIREENALLSFRRLRSYFKLAPLLPTTYLEENLRTALKETNQENQADDHLAFFPSWDFYALVVSQIIVFLQPRS